ncbi:hypothetical protein [Staphylococcus coagulans]|uniref:hypothetical protein n=1 Tax=Staphylococcus coagulans TaxID=74706 RepID=UPI0030ED901D
MIIDKLETFILNIDQMNHRMARRKLLKLLRQVNLQVVIHAEWAKHQQKHMLKIQIPKRALPYVISFISFHHYRIYQIVPLSLLESMEPLQIRPREENRFEIQIDGLNDLFIKDKVIDILNVFQNKRIHYSFAKDKLKVTTTPEVLCQLIATLATRHIDICQASAPARCYRQSRIS